MYKKSHLKITAENRLESSYLVATINYEGWIEDNQHTFHTFVDTFIV